MTREGRSPPLILFGAFDRHNFGDLLFPHVAAAMLPGRALILAGLAQRDLRTYGGHATRVLAGVLAAGDGTRRHAALRDAVPREAAPFDAVPPDLLHVGGELLDCDAWQAALMLCTPGEAQAAIARVGSDPAARLRWARDRLGVDSLAPYVVARDGDPRDGDSRDRNRGRLGRVAFEGVGGVRLDACNAALRDEVIARLAAATRVTVRDERTLAHLRAAGVAATLAPDPVVLVAELFGERIRAHGERALEGAPSPRGEIAVQFSADYGDDATLAAIAAQLERATAASGCGIVLFRAGAAPWHDELEPLQRLAARLHGCAVRVFESLDVWDICALIAQARAVCSSSLHGRIVATAFTVPHLALRHPVPAARTGKLEAWAATWEAGGRAGLDAATLARARPAPSTVDVDALAPALEATLDADRRALRALADALAARSRASFEALRAALAERGG